MHQTDTLDDACLLFCHKGLSCHICDCFHTILLRVRSRKKYLVAYICRKFNLLITQVTLNKRAFVQNPINYLGIYGTKLVSSHAHF